ncbi:MAG: HEAT repeat domain-containing protein [candidate division WOR-3 bacterium]|nr:MAG: HEAT repeat domain-containing protein [candidate division WOR-3 bacterium]
MKDDIAQIILGLTKSFKAMQIYGMNHSSFRHFFEPFYQTTAEYLKTHNEISFKVEKFQIVNVDQVVYKEEEMDMNIAFRLFKDGIRNISFLSGLTSDELLLFVDVISRPTKDWDVALGLWECNFTHITFYVIEAEEVLDYRVPDVPIQYVDYDEKLKQLILREKIDIDAVIVPDLDNQEVENLKTSISTEEKTAILPVVIKTLGDYLQTECSQEIIDGLIEILESCVNVKDFYNARRIAYKLKDIPDVNFIERFENETTIASFKETVNVPEDDVFNEFLAFIGFFGKKSIPFLMQLMPFIERSDRLNALRHRVAHMAMDDPAPVIAFLRSKEPGTVLDAVNILGLIKPTKIAQMLDPLVYHPNREVRLAVIDALGNAEEIDIVTKYINDPDVEVRIRSLRMLGKYKRPEIYPLLLERIKKSSFLGLEFAEQREIFSVLTANAGESFINTMREMLYKHKWFGQKKYRVMRRLAALALNEIGTEESLAVLKKGTQKRNNDIRLACESVLKERTK